MYSSSYSRAKLGPESRQPLYRNKGKSCGYYMRIVFFFSSLIQSLIIVSLVLFLIYGQPEKSAEEKRVEELEQGFNKLNVNNFELKKEKAELEAKLAAQKAEKAALEKQMAKQLNESTKVENELKKKITTLQNTVTLLQRPTRTFIPPPPPPPVTNNNQGILKATISEKEKLIALVKSNFTQTVQYLSHERDRALRERDVHIEEAINLRRDNNLLREQLNIYTRKCKEDFAQSLDGIQSVTTKFLNQIHNMFPHSQTFHLSCQSQREQLEKIRSSCTNLSRDVESKFQLYLDNVGNKVVEIQGLSSKLEAHNSYLTSSLEQCEKKHKEAVAKAASDLELKQKAHDDKVEQILIEKKRLSEQKTLLDEKLALREKEIQMLKESMPKTGPLTAASPQSVPQQGRPAAANWPVNGSAGVSNAPIVG
ncbi:PREDICTED: plasmalemma vesicle-associated protein [Cyprinodon variegatus]|uniref:Plasmalemma vesicle associated protein b n=1 Tax=Cyprinodon variegatus TaxID=28743 RepID=A0A3Q2DHC1_CYPVA|nr:PREDICTED: plasmalemma vesicle-associated protein [Cyprinodon variegatus]